jgi:small GTP-binding protein
MEAGDQQELVRKKIIFLGDSAVGKTSLIRRFVINSFDDKYISTIGTKVSKKVIKIEEEEGGNEYCLEMLIWDIIGQKNYEIVLSSALHGAHGAIIVCDVTREDTLKSLNDYWIPALSEAAPSASMVFLANKADLEDEAVFWLDDLKAIGDEHKAACYLTSAKSGTNVDDSFFKLAIDTLHLSGDANDLTQPTNDIYRSIKLLQMDLKSKRENMPLPSVIDAILSDFCGVWDKYQLGMHVARERAELIGLDLNEPKKDDVIQFIEELKRVEQTFLKSDIIDKNYKRRKSWVDVSELD